MNWPAVKGMGSSAEAEKGFLFGFNGESSAINAGSPVCWDAVAADGKTFKLPTNTGFTNFPLFAGIAEDTVSTVYPHSYTKKIVVYGPVTARTWGVATTFIPGANVGLVAGKDYLAYLTAGQINGVEAQNQLGYRAVALETNATAATSTSSVWIAAL